MSKKSVFILFVISFFVGFMLREMLLGVSSDYTYEEMDNLKGPLIMPVENTDEPILEIVKLILPKKAFRGNSLEMIAYLKALKHIDGDYSLVVLLTNDIAGVRIKAGAFHMVNLNNWPKDEAVKIGPFRLSIPEQAPLGQYTVMTQLVRGKGEVAIPLSLNSIRTNEAGSTIDIVSYN